MKVTSFILCDHIRKEDTGRFILLGVFPTLNVVNDLPIQNRWNQFFTFFFYVGLTFDRSKESGLYRIIATSRSNGKRYLLVNLDIKEEGNDSIGLSLVAHLEFTNADIVDVEIFKADDDSKKIEVGSFSFADEVL